MSLRSLLAFAPFGAGAADVPEWCWRAPFTAARCCSSTEGLLKCFDEDVSLFKTCCPWGSQTAAMLRVESQEEAWKAEGHRRHIPGIRESALPWPKGISVDMIITATLGELEMLHVLLHSVKLFWPPDWGSVIIVLPHSDMAGFSRAHEALLPDWVEVKFAKPAVKVQVDTETLEALPKHYQRITKDYISSGDLDIKTDNHFDFLFSDSYSSADFLVLAEVDSVLVSFGAPWALFDHTAGRPRPFVHGQTWHWNAVLAWTDLLGVDPVAEFVEFPIAVRRSHMSSFRSWLHGHLIRLKFLDQSKTIEDLRSSSTAHVALTHLAPQSGLGLFLWTELQEEYAWSLHIEDVQTAIRHRIPAWATCPAPRILHEPHNMNKAATMGAWGAHDYPVVKLQISRRSHRGRPISSLSGLAYHNRAWRSVAAGLCSAQWGGLRGDLFNMSTLKVAQLREELCAPADSSFNLNTTLLSGFCSQFDGGAPMAHCGGRQPSLVVRDFAWIMSAHIYDPYADEFWPWRVPRKRRRT